MRSYLLAVNLKVDTMFRVFLLFLLFLRYVRRTSNLAMTGHENPNSVAWPWERCPDQAQLKGLHLEPRAHIDLLQKVEPLWRSEACLT